MRLTRHTDYALRLLMCLGLSEAREDGTGRAQMTIAEIAARYGISENHLMKVAHRLGRDGFIVTTRGRSGGLRLARDPKSIGLGAVVRACEDDLGLVECFDPATNTCPIAGVCGLPPILGEALEAFLAVLDRYTLADILREPAALGAILMPE